MKRTKDSVNSTSTEIFRSNKIATNVTEPIRSQVNDDVEDNESIITSRFLNINDHTILSPRVPEIILEKPHPAPRVEGRESWQQMTQKSDFSKNRCCFSNQQPFKYSLTSKFNKAFKLKSAAYLYGPQNSNFCFVKRISVIFWRSEQKSFLRATFKADFFFESLQNENNSLNLKSMAIILQ